MNVYASELKEYDSKKSQYIGELLKAVNKRSHERDIAHERKISRENVQEDAEFWEKDKFLNKMYKQKLAE
jgi:hypothetical protein